MELWIRSQDREKLLKCNDIAILNNMINEKEITRFKGYKIVGKNTEYEDLGIYETKERALEVLDEIQNILKPTAILDTPDIKCDGNFYNGLVFKKYNVEIKELSTFVYQMPEK